ncbi:Na(+)/H(+) antiporter subunit D [Arcobacter sp. LA11]|uniref:Na(+)/H(+) antiporter subunit D n=1 Tax=Arcobacter sp. LA11 TaxID=1898176 RepID=UPI000934263B|nr:Na(+)/H(+) antiporter subunit D [Arcobacter sp. LA11]
MDSFLPILPFFIAAILTLFTRGSLRATIMIVTPIIAAYGIYNLEVGHTFNFTLMGFELEPIRIDKLSMLFGYLFCVAGLLGNIYALYHKDTMQHFAAQAYAGSAIGAVFAGDMLTLFIYWELMALTSSVLIFARRTDASLHAGIRYLAIQIISGLLLLAGIIVYYNSIGNLNFNHIGLDAPGAWLFFLAFGIKSAFPFLHNWLTDAYPEATESGTVFLSSFTTKVAVYALARSFAGEEILIYIGATMAFFPIYYAVIENDLRRVLTYSLINQIGFMVVGVGIGTELALNGAVAHAFADVIFKGLLMMTMGAVLWSTGEMRGSELGGLYKKMPKTTWLCIIGAASISAFPLFSGFVTKSIIVSAVLAEGYYGVWLILLFAAAGVFHHAGIKIPFFAFFAHDSKFIDTAKEAPKNMLWAMSLSAVLCIAIGCFPQTFYSLLPWEMDYTVYDTTHVLTQLQLLFFSALAFVWLKLAHIYPPELKSVNIDAEWIYRKLFPKAIYQTSSVFGAYYTKIECKVEQLLNSSKSSTNKFVGADGFLSNFRSLGGMVMWVAVILSTSLFLYYI